jgi:succinyl-CoA synthetase alpha subunit
MKKYGTDIVAGVTPGKGGKEVEGIPVYDFVKEAVNNHDINAAISFVPPPYAKDSCIEVIENSIKFLILTTEQIPEHDVVQIIKYAENKGARILGPGSAGLISPGKCKLGVHPPNMFKEGHIGVVSKSGALSYEVGKTLTENGIGQSTVVAIGGGPYWGFTQLNIIKLFQEDDETKMIVLLGEIGGTMEEETAKFVKKEVDKPVISLIVGSSAPKGKSLGHAGAIIEGNLGTAKSKINALREAGTYIAKNHMDIVEQIRKIKGR